MKWFKHMSDSLDDPFIQELLDEYSHLGYVIWFGLIEIIAKENGTNVTGKVNISPEYLRRKLRTSQKKLRKVLDFCQANDRLKVNYCPTTVGQLSGNSPTTVGQLSGNCLTSVGQLSGNCLTSVGLLSNTLQKKWEIYFPKIMEIKDNYMKDLQVARKKPSNHKEEEVEEEEYKEEVEEEADKKRKKSSVPFEEILTDLNKQTEKNYRLTKGTRELIKARLSEGFCLEDFKTVHLNMSAKWKHDPKMNPYLRPVTLYCASKFEGYLNSTVSMSDRGQVSRLLEKSKHVFEEFAEEQRRENAQREAVS